MFNNLNQLEDNVNQINDNDNISQLFDNINAEIQIYKNYMINPSVYQSLSSLNQENQVVQDYFNTVNAQFALNLSDLYADLSSVIQNVYNLINSYNANATIQDRLRYLVFDYCNYYKDNILPLLTVNNKFCSALMTNGDNQIIFNDLLMSYENKNFNVFNVNEEVLFSFIGNNNGSSFTIELPNALAIQNVQYTAAIACNNDTLYLYISESPGFSVGNFQTFFSDTSNFTGLFLSATANDISSVYFNSNLTPTSNMPSNCFYNDLYNSIIYKSIGIPMKMQFVNYDQYMPVLVACNSNNQPQWIVQNESGVPLCVINQLNGQFVAYFAISDSACVMVTFNNNVACQSVISGGIDSYMWNVV